MLLFLAPAVNLVWRGGTGYIFFALLALALYVAARHGRVSGYFSALRKYPWFVAGMCGLLVAVIIQQISYGLWMPRQLDAYARFALAIPIFLMLRQMPSRYFRALGWGCAAGALIVGAQALLDRPAGGWTDGDRLGNAFTNPIPYGDTALLLAFLAVFTIGWDGKHRKWASILKILALVAGGFSSYCSGTRGGWLAIPLFLVMLGLQYGWFSNTKRRLISAVTVAIVISGLFATPFVEQRAHDFTADMMQFSKGDPNSSTGLRLELWRASAHLYALHPLYGVGKGKLMSALGTLAKQGYVTGLIVNERGHSDFFSTLAELGSIGIVCLLAFYYGSAVYFWRRRSSTDAFIRSAAWAGLAVSASTIVFGLTIDVLVPIMVTVLIALLLAAFLAAIDAREAELARQP